MIVKPASALRRTLRIACERPRATLWTLLAATCALFAIAAAMLALDRVDRSPDVPRGAASMVVYLGDSLDDARAHALETELAALPGVLHAELVAPAESARRLQQALANDPALLDGVDISSLPSSIELQLAPGVRDVIAMSPTLQSLRGAPGIEDVVVEDAGADRLADTFGSLRVVAWTAAAVLAALSLVVVVAALRVRLERGRQEQRAYELCGASPAFAIVPTALAGALHGIVAALVAALALYLALAVWGDDLARALHGMWELSGPSLAELALLVALGGALGSIAGGLAGASRAPA
ncbi:MAG: cell division protein FtsX [Acidobacteriota bacterium]